LLPNSFVQGQPYLFQGAVIAELAEVSPNRFFGRQITGNHAPLTARFLDIEEGVEDFPQRPLSWSATFFGVTWGQKRFDLAPLRVGQVAGIAGTHVQVIAQNVGFYTSSKDL
jgi:hypothetical protein